MDIYAVIVKDILKAQETIIGPLAVEQARKVPGLIISGESVQFNGNQIPIIEQLVEKYRDLFGTTSIEVCRNAAKKELQDLPKDKIPPILQ